MLFLIRHNICFDLTLHKSRWKLEHFTSDSLSFVLNLAHSKRWRTMTSHPEWDATTQCTTISSRVALNTVFPSFCSWQTAMTNVIICVRLFKQCKHQGSRRLWSLQLHWKSKVVMLPNLGSLEAPQTICGATSDDKVGIMTTSGCPCLRNLMMQCRTDTPK